jgi:hypothetical protein
MNHTLSSILATLCLLICLVSISTGAWATVAANTRIINQASLSYNDGVGTKTATAAVTVTVSLVPASPTIVPGPPQSTSYSGPGTSLTNAFIITAAANGPDTYGITTAITGSSNTSAPTATVTTPSVSLGATVTLAGSTQSTIVVPADGAADSNVNGIQAGDTVVIGGETRSVLSVTDNAGGTSTIVLAAALSNPAPGTGVLVAEQKTVTVTVTAGTITTAGVDVTVAKNITATSTTVGTATATSGSVTDTYTSGVATLTKFVRNATVPSGSGVPFIHNGTSYFPTAVTARPGDTLEYILVAANGGSGAVTAAAINDILPADFVTLKASAYGAGREVTYVNDAGASSTMSAAADADQASYDAAQKKLTVFVGTGATNAAGGSIPGGNKSVLVLYQVTVNP